MMATVSTAADRSASRSAREEGAVDCRDEPVRPVGLRRTGRHGLGLGIRRCRHQPRAGLIEERRLAAGDLDPPGAKLGDHFSNIRIPILHMTGTRDVSSLGDTKAEDRRVPFDRITGADQFLVTFEGGDHMVFSGVPRTIGTDRLFHNLILQSTTAFWDAHLKDDAKAKDWLAGGAFEKVLGKDGKFEKKAKAP